MDASRIAAEASRLFPLANQVLGSYPFTVADLRHLATHSNVLYRVTSTMGQQMVLRMGASQPRRGTNIELEVGWLNALSHETSLDVVTPIPTRDGSLIVDVDDPATGMTRSCVLFSWIPGAPLADGAGPFGYRLLGQMAASLQKHGKTWHAPNTAEMRHWNRIFYYEPDLEPVVIANPVYDHLFSSARLRVIDKATASAAEVISESWADGGAQTVHGDLHEWNVHIMGSRLYAFDFEDVMIALPAQDVSISLYSSRANGNHREIARAFRHGFESVAEWPVVDERQLDGFYASRQIMLMNHAARILPVKEAADYIDQVMPWLEGYVRRYG